MAVKTYQVGLELVLNATYKYITKWQLKLRDSLTSEQFECLTAVLAAVTSCLALLGPRPIE